MAAAVKLLRPAGRRRVGRFLAEGPNMIEAALARGLVLDVLATESAVRRFDELLGDETVHVVTDKAARALSETVTPVGVFAVCAVPEHRLSDVLAASPRLLLVTVDTAEPGNAGTLIRIADAMGADAVILAGNGVDPYNGKCLRASAGSIFALPVVVQPDVPELVAALRGAGITVLATTVDGELSLPEAVTDAPTAWVFGSEAHGLPVDLAALADARVRIPMRGSAESLNIASAAAICLYHSSSNAPPSVAEPPE